MSSHTPIVAETVTSVNRKLNARPKVKRLYYHLSTYAKLHPGQPMPRAELVRLAWGADYLESDYSATLEVHICFLRAALGDTDKSKVVTVRGVGYWLNSEAA